MTDTESEPVLEVVKPAKKPRKKRELTEEQKQKLREQLKKGRETALKNRQKKALVKKALKKEREEAEDKLIAEKVLNKKDNTHEETFNLMKSEINELKEKFGELDAQQIIDLIKQEELLKKKVGIRARGGVINQWAKVVIRTSFPTVETLTCATCCPLPKCFVTLHKFS